MLTVYHLRLCVYGACTIRRHYINNQWLKKNSSSCCLFCIKISSIQLPCAMYTYTQLYLRPKNTEIGSFLIFDPFLELF